MTAIGCIVEPHQAILWADTLFFAGGEPAGHRDKLALNHAARIAGCGTGNGAICQGGRDAIGAAADIHQLVDMLPRALSRIASGITADRPMANTRGTFIAAGWSSRWRRMLAYEFVGPAFRAQPIMFHTSPYVSEAATIANATFGDVTGIAQQQIADLARANGCTITGRVDAVTITANEVAARVLLDLGGGDSQPASLDQQQRAAALGGV